MSNLVLTKSPGQTFTAAVQRNLTARLHDIKASVLPSAVVPDFRSLPSLARLQELFAYNPKTGKLTAKVARGGLSVGKEVGSRCNCYRQIFVDYEAWKAHRIAFKLHHGRNPIGLVHHVNGVRDDNRACNLVEATHRENSWQRHKASSNTKVIGVSWIESKRRFRADICFHGNGVILGNYVKLGCAVQARRLAERILYDFDREQIGEAA